MLYNQTYIISYCTFFCLRGDKSEEKIYKPYLMVLACFMDHSTSLVAGPEGNGIGALLLEPE